MAIPLSHVLSSQTPVHNYQLQVILRLTVSHSVCLGVEPRLGPMARFFFSYMKVSVLFSWGLSFVSHSPY
jgi:hypothetical protein